VQGINNRDIPHKTLAPGNQSENIYIHIIIDIISFQVISFRIVQAKDYIEQM